MGIVLYSNIAVNISRLPLKPNKKSRLGSRLFCASKISIS